jgi:hypothetical protein
MEGEGEGEGARRAGDGETARAPWVRTGEEAAVLGVCVCMGVRMCVCRRPHTV